MCIHFEVIVNVKVKVKVEININFRCSFDTGQLIDILLLRLPEGLSLAGPSVDMSQQHFDHFSDKIN